MAGGSSWPWPLDGLPPESAGSAGGVLGFGRGPAPDRPRTGLAPAAGQPLAGQAGPAELDPPPWPEPPRVMGGAELRSWERAWLQTGPEEAGPEEAGAAVDAARDRVPAPAPAPGDRPAPRDQPEAHPAPPADPFDPLPFGRGGRSRGGATRPPALSASVTFLARADPAPLAPVMTRRESELTSPSPSAGGGASGRSRDA
jgi:hypothetical protein